MTGTVIKVNHQRGLVIFEDETGDCGYFEVLGSGEFEADETIIGDLHSLGEEIIVSIPKKGQKTKVYIEDCGMSLQNALEIVFG